MAPLYSPIAKMPPAQSIRPLSAISASDKNGVGSSTMIRSQFTFTTWMLIGATIQSVLFLLPVRPFYILLPAITTLLYRLLTDILMSRGFIHNTYLDDVIQGKYTAVFPSNTPDSKSETREEDVCIFLLTARNNHPLSLLAPNWKEFGDFFPPMLADLEANAATNGFLGGSSWLSSSDRHTQNELLITMYFRSAADVHAFAHSPVHRAGWDWYNALLKKGGAKHIGISHEIYHTKKGGWETIYGNTAPNSLGELDKLDNLHELYANV